MELNMNWTRGEGDYFREVDIISITEGDVWNLIFQRGGIDS